VILAWPAGLLVKREVPGIAGDCHGASGSGRTPPPDMNPRRINEGSHLSGVAGVQAASVPPRKLQRWKVAMPSASG
jgi:hypothetical protein